MNKFKQLLKKAIGIMACMTVMATSVVSAGATTSIASDNSAGNAVEEFSRTAIEITKDMGHGINLGNTMEATNTWDSNPSTSNFEQAWGQPVTTEAMFKSYKDAGFDSVRIPIAWTSGMYGVSSDLLKKYGKDLVGDNFKKMIAEGDGIIKQEFFDRIDTLIGYALKYDMYVIINDHWDYGWWENFTTEHDMSMSYYENIWTQVADHYKNYGEKLIFESANEELTIADPWDDPAKKMNYELITEINQKFVDVVRSSGGNNDKRYLLIAGANTDVDKTTANEYVMPTDTIDNHMMISVHYYSDTAYCLDNVTWTTPINSWGTDSDKNFMENNMKKLKKFTDAGVGVIIGEYAVVPEYINDNYVRKNNDCDYLKYFLNLCSEYGYAHCLWDTGSFFDKSKLEMRWSDIANLYLENPKMVVSASNTELVCGKTGQITVKQPVGKITYKSSNEKIATVSSTGLVTAKYPGVATITITDSGNSKVAQYSKTVTYTVYPTKNAAPKLSNYSSGVTVSWAKNASATGYYVYRSINDGSYSQIYMASGSDTTAYKDSTAKENGAKYQYKIIAFNYDRSSRKNIKAEESDSVIIYRLSRPTIKSAKNVKKYSISMKWGKNSKANGYQVKYVGNSKTKTATLTSKSKYTKKLTSLKKNKKYKLYVRSYKKVNGKKYYSAWSKVKTVKIKK